MDPTGIPAADSAPGPTRPTLIRTGLATLMGLVAGGLVLALLYFGLAIVGLDGLYGDGHDFIGWPVPAVDAWSLVFDVARVMFASWVLAWFLRLIVRLTIPRWDLRVWPVALSIAIGWLAVLTWTTIVAFALVVIVVHRIGLSEIPAPRWRPRRRVAATVAVIIALVAMAAVSYHPLHPLAAASEPSFEWAYESDYRAATIVPSQRAAQQPSLVFSLRNDGLARVTLHSVTAEPRSVNPRLPRSMQSLFGASGSSVTVDGGYGSLGTPRPIVGTVLEPGDQLVVSLRTRPPACATGQIIFAIEHVAVRFRTLGFMRTQRFSLDPKTSVYCPGSA